MPCCRRRARSSWSTAAPSRRARFPGARSPSSGSRLGRPGGLLRRCDRGHGRLRPRFGPGLGHRVLRRPAAARPARAVATRNAEKLERAERWFDRYDDAAVAIGRVLPVIRSFIAIPAGAVEMPLGTTPPSRPSGRSPGTSGWPGPASRSARAGSISARTSGMPTMRCWRWSLPASCFCSSGRPESAHDVAGSSLRPSTQRRTGHERIDRRGRGLGGPTD